MNKIMAQQTYGEWMRSNPPIPNFTAVEWLIMQLPVKIRVELYEQNIHEQAKQMEKQQIIAAHTRAYLIGEDTISIQIANERSEQYYNETYNK